MKLFALLSPNSRAISCFRTVLTTSGSSLLSETAGRRGRGVSTAGKGSQYNINGMILLELSVVPPLKKRTRHWCNHGWSGSMAYALFIDWSINRYFSDEEKNACLKEEKYKEHTKTVSH